MFISNEGKLKEINDYCVGPVHFTHTRLNSLKEFNRETDTLISDLKKELCLLKKDVNTLGKYVNIFYKFKTSRQASKRIEK